MREDEELIRCFLENALTNRIDVKNGRELRKRRTGVIDFLREHFDSFTAQERLNLYVLLLHLMPKDELVKFARSRVAKETHGECLKIIRVYLDRYGKE